MSTEIEMDDLERELFSWARSEVRPPTITLNRFEDHISIEASHACVLYAIAKTQNLTLPYPVVYRRVRRRLNAI